MNVPRRGEWNARIVDWRDTRRGDRRGSGVSRYLAAFGARTHHGRGGRRPERDRDLFSSGCAIRVRNAVDDVVLVSADGGDAGNLRAAWTNYGSGNCRESAEALFQTGRVWIGAAVVRSQYIQPRGGHFRDGSGNTAGIRRLTERLCRGIGRRVAAAAGLRPLQKIC